MENKWLGVLLPLQVPVFYVFVDRASLHNLFQTKPSRYILLLSIFISTSLHVSGNYLPIIRRPYCIYATLVFFTLDGWLSGLLEQIRQPPVYQVLLADPGTAIWQRSQTTCFFLYSLSYFVPALQSTLVCVWHGFTFRP